MQELRNYLYDVASGEIEDPSLTLMIDGMEHTFKGAEAKVFAFGMLAGMKAKKDGCPVTCSVVNSKGEG